MPQRIHVTSVEHDLEADQKETNESGHNEPSEQYHGDEEMRKTLAETFGPSLSAMKLAGEFFGETSSFTELRDSNREKSSVCIWRFYSVLVVLGQWAFVVIAVTSLFYEGFMSGINNFLYLMVTLIWYIQCACNTTICLIVLPLVHNKTSRFVKLISGILTTETEFDGLRRKTLKGLSIACLVSVINSVVIVLFSIYYNGILAHFKPWNGHAAVRVFEIALGIFDSFAWSLPVQLYCVTCLVLERMFEMLKKKVTSSLDTAHSFTIVRLRQQHLKLCDVVELADKMLSPLLLVTITLDIPLICINVYQLIKISKKWSSDTDVILFIGYLYWSVCISCLLAVLCMFGIRVNEKVCFCEYF